MSTEGKQKEENNELDESHEKEKKKNFFQTFLSYFKYEKKLHKKINQSLLFNAYLIVKKIYLFEDFRNRLCHFLQALLNGAEAQHVHILRQHRCSCVLPGRVCSKNFVFEYGLLYYHDIPSDQCNWSSCCDCGPYLFHVIF